MKSFKTAKRNAVVAEFLEVRRLLAAHTWIGANGPNWSDPQNWTGGAPDVNETAIVLDFPFVPALSTFNDIPGLSVDSVALHGPFDVSGDPITLNQGISVFDFGVGWSIDLAIPSNVT